MTYRMCALVGVALLAASFPTIAADAAMRSDDILARQQAIRAGIDANTEPYANLPRAVRKAIQADQRKLEEVLQGKADTSLLAPADQVDVRNLVARIEAAIKNDESERLLCSQEARTGSNYVTRVCRTPAQLREQKERGKKLLEDEVSRVKCNDSAGCV